MAADTPVPNGAVPLAAYAIVTAQEKMSDAGTAWPMICSGAMNPIEPTVMPVPVRTVASPAWAIPKSMTLGPPPVRSTLDGLRSRWTTPTAWIAASASASPVARPYSISAPERALLLDVVGQRGPVDVLGDQERPLRLGVSLDHLYRAHALDPGERGHLTAEPGPELGVLSQFRAQDLHRDRAAVLGGTQVDHAHPAGPQPGGQPVPADPRGVARQ